MRAHLLLLPWRTSPSAAVALLFLPPTPNAAMQQLFPTSFTRLVRVHNHAAADSLLAQHDVAVARRERAAAAAAAAARAQLKASGTDGAEKPVKGSGATWRQRRVAARLAKAEADEARWQARAAELEGQVAQARAAALERPLGTAFFALFRCGWALHGPCSGGRASGVVRVTGPSSTRPAAFFLNLTPWRFGATLLPAGTRPRPPSPATCRPAWPRASTCTRALRPAPTTSTGRRCGAPGARWARGLWR